jgi:hypothetical protein
MTTTPEGWEKKAVDRWLKEVGPDVVWHCKPYMAGFGKSGVPDYLLCLGGALWGLEIKRPGKDATEIQKRRMEAIRRAGGRAVAGTAEVVIHAMTEWLNARGIVVR